MTTSSVYHDQRQQISAKWGQRVAAMLLDYLFVLLILVPLFALIWLGVLLGWLGNISVTEASVCAEDIKQTYASTLVDKNKESCFNYFSSDWLIWLLLISVFLIFVVQIVYYGFSMNRKQHHNGQTYGMQIIGIKVIKENNKKFSFWFAVYRQVLVIFLLFNWFFLFLTLGTVTLINYIWPLLDKNNKALHDYIVKTKVIQSQEPKVVFTSRKEATVKN